MIERWQESEAGSLIQVAIRAYSHLDTGGSCFDRSSIKCDLGSALCELTGEDPDDLLDAMIEEDM